MPNMFTFSVTIFFRRHMATSIFGSLIYSCRSAVNLQSCKKNGDCVLELCLWKTFSNKTLNFDFTRFARTITYLFHFTGYMHFFSQHSALSWIARKSFLFNNSAITPGQCLTISNGLVWLYCHACFLSLHHNYEFVHTGEMENKKEGGGVGEM